ncbi:hypothetical protein NKR19_g9796 [Coniochaeta hoffmannii]|uniref:Promethin n=1 Tax=Coniochaeta hoffmannii TaxID=91930 RepID=A0AA38R8Y7_9PEZI|nr:hypothetical protein NKR19_g9796 [Coniochaeta hoffmannii]
MAVADQATTLAALAQRQLDRVVSPSTRRETWDRTLDVAARRPGAFTFLALLTALSLPPTFLFAAFVLSTLLLALGAAVLFALFWTGVALLLLVPSLFVAAGCAVFLWAWAVGSFVAVRWVAGRTGFDLGFGEGGGGGGAGGKRQGTAKLDGRLEGYGKELEKEYNDVEAEL